MERQFTAESVSMLRLLLDGLLSGLLFIHPFSIQFWFGLVLFYFILFYFI